MKIGPSEQLHSSGSLHGEVANDMQTMLSEGYKKVLFE